MDTPRIEGEMVSLRQLEASDADGVWEIVTDAESARLTGRTSHRTREEVERWCASGGQRADRITWAVTAAGDDGYVGEISLRDVDPGRRCAELVLVQRPAYRGRGYGTESINLVLGYAFGPLALHRVGLEVLALNNRARALYETLGFTAEGRRREAFRDGDQWVDGVLMGILEDEYHDAGA